MGGGSSSSSIVVQKNDLSINVTQRISGKRFRFSTAGMCQHHAHSTPVLQFLATSMYFVSVGKLEICESRNQFECESLKLCSLRQFLPQSMPRDKPHLPSLHSFRSNFGNQPLLEHLHRRQTPSFKVLVTQDKVTKATTTTTQDHCLSCQ